MPLACNEYWRSEPIGWASAITLLREPSLSGKWRAAFEPWADALVALPEEMASVVEKDVAEELSEDESDTEIDPALRFPPSLSKLGEIFDLPSAEPTDASADVTGLDTHDAGTAEEVAPAPTETTAAAAAAAAVDEGDVQILPNRSLPVDMLSECARAEGALGEAAAVARRQQRLRLRERIAQLNESIEQPRHQLSLV